MNLKKKKNINLNIEEKRRIVDYLRFLIKLDRDKKVKTKNKQEKGNHGWLTIILNIFKTGWLNHSRLRHSFNS